MNETDKFLEHFGVKGMKWGKTSAKSSSSDIKSARDRHNARVDKIAELDVQAANSKSAKGRASAVKSMNKLAKEGLDSGDAKTAAKITRGEKTAVALLISPIALAAIPKITRSREAAGEDYLSRASQISTKDYG